MPKKLKLDLLGDRTFSEYFKYVDARLAAMGASRGALARELGMDGGQMNRYFTDADPNPTGKTIVAIEDAIGTLKRRKAQEK